MSGYPGLAIICIMIGIQWGFWPFAWSLLVAGIFEAYLEDRL